MGLDMYLTKRIYVGGNFEHRNVKGSIHITIGGKELSVNLNKVSYIEEQIGYWRKANQIHNWFVKHVQDGTDDCGSYPCSSEQLKELYDTCKKVLKASKLIEGEITNGYSYKDGKKIPNIEKGKVIKDPKVACELLPSSSGFFFGSTEYDQWYFQDIEETIKILEPEINNTEDEFEYHSSW
jgi:hypothetical protein